MAAGEPPLAMKSVRTDIGGLGNLLFKNAYLWAQMREGVIPDVYVQSESYFTKYRDEIRMLYGQGIGFTDKVALHIRRGDYLRVPEFHANLWETEYYRNAVSKFGDERFLVFCKDSQNDAQDKDDMEWCKVNLPLRFPFATFEFHTHTNEVDDLNTMAACRGIIGANSSFSFWAAYLGNPQKRVIMPRESSWFTDGAERTELPDTWEKI